MRDKVWQVLSGSLLLCAGVIVAVTVSQWSLADPEIEGVLARPMATELFGRMSTYDTTDHRIRSSPLVVQAESFARYLNPPKPQKAEVPIAKSSLQPVVPAARPSIRPTVASPKFRLHATCYYPSRPEESRALIVEPGGQNHRWVKEGARLGHFVIHEIRSGAIICLGGEHTHEVLVERGSVPASLVKRHRTALARVASSPGTGRSAVDANMSHEGVP